MASFRTGCERGARAANVVMAALSVALAAGCDSRPSPAAPAREISPIDSTEPTAFVPVAKEAGLTHRHYQPLLDPKLSNIMSWMASVGAAAAAGDFDNDGWIDLFCTNSRKGKPNYLYRNNGDGTFTDVARRAGIDDANDDARGVSMDCAWGDFDNDGWIDLYLVRWGTDSLYRNNGDGTFTDVTARHFKKPDGSVGIAWANGNAVIWLDGNRDGRLDLYVGNYFEDHDLWNLTTTRIMHEDFERARNGGKNFYFEQQTDGTFVERAGELGIDDRGWTLAVGSGDVNNDGWADIYAANDFGPDMLFVNDKKGGFVNTSEKSLGYDTKKGMSADFGDFDNDGWLDIYVANITTAEYLQEGNMLWHNEGPDEDGNPIFVDVSLETGTYDGGWGWGAKLFDYDNDGDLDIFAVNGFISRGEGNYWYDLATWTVQDSAKSDSADAANWPAIGDRSFSGYEPFRMWRNDGVAHFSEVAGSLGLADTRDGRGIVCFDYDNDGDLDIFVANQHTEPELYRNDIGNRNKWLGVRLEADPENGSNRDAIGARVTLVTDSRSQMLSRERDGGNGYGGQSDPRVYFGLGPSDERVRLLEVRWPSGGLQYVENVPVNQIITVREDREQFAEASGMNVPPPTPWGRPAGAKSARFPEITREEREKLLAQLEAAIPTRSADYQLGSLHRSRCVEYDLFERSILFWEGAVANEPDSVFLRLQYSGAFVDKIPTCGGLAAVVSKGQLATKALNQLDAVLEQKPDWWPAFYARGMNHLHWPRALRHTPAAIEDFKRCLELQKKAGAPNERPYYVRTYVLLGDAYAKNKKPDSARETWNEGIEVFPDNADLKKRLSIPESELLDFVLGAYNLENPIDTDFSFLMGYE